MTNFDDGNIEVNGLCDWSTILSINMPSMFKLLNSFELKKKNYKISIHTVSSYINAYIGNSNSDASFCSLEISNITVEYLFKLEAILKLSKVPLYINRSSTKI